MGRRDELGGGGGIFCCEDPDVTWGPIFSISGSTLWERGHTSVPTGWAEDKQTNRHAILYMHVHGQLYVYMYMYMYVDLHDSTHIL